MKVRPISKLLQLVRDELERSKSGEHTSKYRGLCEIMGFLYHGEMLTEMEKSDLLVYFGARLPIGIFLFNWEPYLIAPRMAWLNTHIELAKKNYENRD